MAKNPEYCLPGDSVTDVAKKMRTHNIGSTPIVENAQTKKLLGIVTDRDLALRVVAEGRDPKSTTVREVMTPNPVTCRAADDMDKASKSMAEHQVRRIPVVDDQNQLVGIIAQADLALQAQPQKTGEVVREISKPG